MADSSPLVPNDEPVAPPPEAPPPAERARPAPPPSAGEAPAAPAPAAVPTRAPAPGPWDALLSPGERVVWADHAHDHASLGWLGFPPRTPGRLVGTAVLFSLGVFLGALALGPFVAILIALLLPALALHERLRGRHGPRYALTDQGRGFVAEAGHTRVFTLPAKGGRIEGSSDGEVGDICLGELEVRTEPGGALARTDVVLQGVAYPSIVLDLAQDLGIQRRLTPSQRLARDRAIDY